MSGIEEESDHNPLGADGLTSLASGQVQGANPGLRCRIRSAHIAVLANGRDAGRLA